MRPVLVIGGSEVPEPRCLRAQRGRRRARGVLQERQVQPLFGPPRVGATKLVTESLLFRLGELQASRQLGQGFFVIRSIDVDPQELSIPKLGDVEVGQVHAPVVAIGIEQSGGDGAQLTKLS